MIKPDEITFLMLMQIRCRRAGLDGGETPRAIIASIPHLVAEKRALYLLGKWEGKGWYEYGTVIDMGWLTEAGKAATYKAEWEHQQKVAA
jgi:hypothetical protein